MDRGGFGVLFILSCVVGWESLRESEVMVFGNQLDLLESFNSQVISL